LRRRCTRCVEVGNALRGRAAGHEPDSARAVLGGQPTERRREIERGAGGLDGRAPGVDRDRLPRSRVRPTAPSGPRTDYDRQLFDDHVDAVRAAVAAIAAP
jgi:hypothetical protein